MADVYFRVSHHIFFPAWNGINGLPQVRDCGFPILIHLWKGSTGTPFLDDAPFFGTPICCSKSLRLTLQFIEQLRCVQCDTFRPKRAHHCKTCRRGLWSKIPSRPSSTSSLAHGRTWIFPICALTMRVSCWKMVAWQNRSCQFLCHFVHRKDTPNLLILPAKVLTKEMTLMEAPEYMAWFSTKLLGHRLRPCVPCWNAHGISTWFAGNE